VVFAASRYGKGEGDDYLNCPMDKPEYLAFVERLCAAELTELHPFEKPKFFEGCLPIEVMASRGPRVLAFGPMKPVGLEDPRTGRRPYAVVQLRQENREGTAYNLVGFQTRMKQSSQGAVFRTIPGLGSAEFLRWGSVHRNTYVHGPTVFDDHLRLRQAPHLRLAGQITGVEGYVESQASGLLTALLLVAELRGLTIPLPPAETALGAMRRHVCGELEPDTSRFQPTNIHFGMMPGVEVDVRRVGKAGRRQAVSDRAIGALSSWLAALRAQGIGLAGFTKHHVEGLADLPGQALAPVTGGVG
jgi:methylenetetrahydrofolate--tRNA-(uracil-5-)-methyltransferase